MFCAHCGNEIPRECSWKFCVQCGKSLNREEKCTSINEVEVPAKPDEKDMFVHLSPGAKESFIKLKKKYKAGLEKDSSVLTLYVQLLNTDRRYIRKLDENIKGKVVINIDRTSNSLEWAKILAEELKMFNLQEDSFNFFLHQHDKQVVSPVITVIDLQKKAHLMHKKELQVFAVVSKKLVQLKAKTTDRGLKQKKLTTSHSAVKQEQIVSVSSEEEEEEVKKEIVHTHKTTVQEVSDTVNECDKEEASTSCAKTTVQEVSDTVNKCEKEEASTSCAEPSTSASFSDDASLPLKEVDVQEDHEWEKFLRLQSRLMDRKNEAALNVKKAKDAKYNRTKQFQIFYLARNNIGLVFKASVEDDIGYLYDMVCHMVAAEVLAPKFHFKSGTDVFPRTFRGRLDEVPDVLQIVEEDFDADDTLTNFDDVTFKAF